MNSHNRNFLISLAASTALAFGSLLIAFWWANRELAWHFAREKMLLDAVPSRIPYSSMTVELAFSIAMAIGLSGFAATAILGASRRNWTSTVLVLVPAALWFLVLVGALVATEEEYFP